MPSATGDLRRKIVEQTRAEGIPVKTLPGLHELISGDINLAGQIRPVQVEDVLGREQVEVDLEAIAKYIRGRTILVTGAGGSIGSELCRQVVHLGAAKLVLVEQGESALYEMQRELVDERAFTAVIPILADCGDAAKMRQVFERYPTDVVFHAAAYKHVPMLETNPLQAVTNNVLATRVMAQVAVEFGVDRFVFISTDKAANPKNLLGQSKAVCEWIVESFALRDDVDTRFVAVRFGNVLGSSGSVIPIFRRQIERGGPVTVTHPGDDALLHDDPRGRLAGRPGRRHGRTGTGVRARHGQARTHPRPRAADDRAFGSDRTADPHRATSARARARRCTRSSGTRASGWGRPRTRRSCARPGRRSSRPGSRTSSPSSSVWSRRATCTA